MNDGVKSTAPADSRVVTNHSTEGALSSLTLEIEQDPVVYARCGRTWLSDKS